MHTITKYLSCSKTEALEYFQLSDIRYDDKNAVTESFSTTSLQLYLIWTTAQTLEHKIELQRQI